MSRPVAICALTFIVLAFVQFLFPGAIMAVLCTMTVGTGNFIICTMEILFWCAYYTFPVALLVLPASAVAAPERWEAQLKITGLAWAIAVALLAAVQFPAHLWMLWQLSEIRQEFREKSGGATLACTVDWESIDRRNALLVGQGYTMYGPPWEVSGQVMYDESHKPDTCNVSTSGSVYLFTWWPGSIRPKRFSATR